MNDDKDRILQACNSFSAEELFHFIRSGDLTLLDLVRAGLDDNKLVGLQELMAIEEDDLWAEVQTKRTPALCRRYLQAYPNGRYAGRCTKLMLQLADGPTDDRPAPDATPTADQAATPPTPPAPTATRTRHLRRGEALARSANPTHHAALRPLSANLSQRASRRGVCRNDCPAHEKAK